MQNAYRISIQSFFQIKIYLFNLNALNLVLWDKLQLMKLKSIILFFCVLFFGMSVKADICTSTNTANGNDDAATTATVTDFSCTGAFPIMGATLDASIGSFCPSWYTYDIIVNGTTIATSQCDQTGFDLTAYLPLTSVSIISNDEDSFSDGVTMQLTVNLTYFPDCPTPYNINLSTAVDSLFSSWSWTESGPSFPATGFNLQYGGFGFDLFTGINETVNASDFTDTLFNSNFIGGAVYELYMQTLCGSDTSAWTGPIQFTMPLTNNNVCNAETLLTDNTLYVLNNVGATVQTGESVIAPPATGCSTLDGWCNSDIDFTTWFKFEAPVSGKITISGMDLNFDGQIAIYKVDDCNDFNTFSLIVANDDDYLDNMGFAPNFDICDLTPGQTYFLMHDSYSSFSTGNYSIRLNSRSAGQDGTLTVCKNEPMNLFDGLNDTWEDSGTWFNPLGSQMAGSITSAFDYSAFFNYMYVVDGNTCPDDTSVVLVEVLDNCDYLGIDNLENETIRLYPNPTSGKIMIESTELNLNSFQIFNIEGREIPYSVSLITPNKINLDISGNEKGIYFIHITENKNSVNLKVILN